MWRLHDLIELLTKAKPGKSKILGVSLLDCPHAGATHRFSCRNVEEVWVSSTADGVGLLCKMRMTDGRSQIFHGANPSEQEFAQLERLY